MERQIAQIKQANLKTNEMLASLEQLLLMHEPERIINELDEIIQCVATQDTNLTSETADVAYQLKHFVYQVREARDNNS